MSYQISCEARNWKDLLALLNNSMNMPYPWQTLGDPKTVGRGPRGSKNHAIAFFGSKTVDFWPILVKKGQKLAIIIVSFNLPWAEILFRGVKAYLTSLTNLKAARIFVRKVPQGPGVQKSGIDHPEKWPFLGPDFGGPKNCGLFDIF